MDTTTEYTNLEQYVNNEDVEDILEWDNDAVKDRLELWDPVDCLEGPEDSEQFKRL